MHKRNLYQTCARVAAVMIPVVTLLLAVSPIALGSHVEAAPTSKETNLAYNPSRTGFPHPLESSTGWGGGADQWDILDGMRSYDTWASGLAFTGGSAPYIEPCGVRSAIVNFGTPRTFDSVVIWHHGEAHTPQSASMKYWDGSQWKPVKVRRLYTGDICEEGTNSGYACADVYLFKKVTGSKVSYSFDNCGKNILGTPNEHGWIYEMEVYGP